MSSDTKKHDGVAFLTEVTGLPRGELVDLANRVKENHRLLESCDYHDFSPILPRDPIRQRYRCINCGGEIDSQAFFWHEKGRRRPS